MMARAARIMMDGLRARLAELQAEHKRMRDGLQWIADQFCDSAPPDDRLTKVCSESGDCITEWCLPCFAEAVLQPVEDVPDRAKEGAATMVVGLAAERDQLRKALMSAVEWIDADSERRWTLTEQDEFDRLVKLANGES